MKKIILLAGLALFISSSGSFAQTLENQDKKAQPIKKSAVDKAPEVEKKFTPAPAETQEAAPDKNIKSEKGEVKSSDKNKERGLTDEKIRHAEERSGGKAFSGKSKEGKHVKKGKHHDHKGQKGKHEKKMKKDKMMKASPERAPSRQDKK